MRLSIEELAARWLGIPVAEIHRLEAVVRVEERQGSSPALVGDLGARDGWTTREPLFYVAVVGPDGRSDESRVRRRGKAALQTARTADVEPCDLPAHAARVRRLDERGAELPRRASMERALQAAASMAAGDGHCREG